MLESIVSGFWEIVLLYVVAGILFGIPFVFVWIGRLDPAAKAGSWGFRLAILPGVVALWPVAALKTIRATRARYAFPDPERPVAPAVQRKIHGVAFVVIAVFVPILCAAALLSRPRVQSSVARQLSREPYSTVIPLAMSRPGDLPLDVTLRTDGKRRQVQFDVARALDDPVVAVYWSPEARAGGIAANAVFLGSVWGPARLLFPLPEVSERIPGVLTFIALAGGQRVVGTLELK